MGSALGTGQPDLPLRKWNSAENHPVIQDVDGQARKVLEEAQAGLFFEWTNVSRLCEAILHLYRNPELRESLGMNGQSYIQTRLSREQTAKEYITLLKKLAPNSNS